MRQSTPPERNATESSHDGSRSMAAAADRRERPQRESPEDIRRGIPPGIGKLALVGGFVQFDRRRIFEELPPEMENVVGGFLCDSGGAHRTEATVAANRAGTAFCRQSRFGNLTRMMQPATKSKSNPMLPGAVVV